MTGLATQFKEDPQLILPGGAWYLFALPDIWGDLQDCNLHSNACLICCAFPVDRLLIVLPPLITTLLLLPPLRFLPRFQPPCEDNECYICHQRRRVRRGRCGCVEVGSGWLYVWCGHELISALIRSFSPEQFHLLHPTASHAAQLSFISLSQICDSNLGALSAIQPPPSLPQ